LLFAFIESTDCFFDAARKTFPKPYPDKTDTRMRLPDQKWTMTSSRIRDREIDSQEYENRI
jgi:hypothetical protein